MSTAPVLKTEAKRFLNFIGGEWVPPTTGTYAPNMNPANLEDIVGDFPTSGVKDAQAAVAAAKAAFPEWSGMPAPSRGRILAKAATLFRERLDDIARTLCREEGKTVAEAKGEV